MLYGQLNKPGDFHVTNNDVIECVEMNEACQRAAASLSTEKLQRLFDDDDKLRQFAKEIPEVS